MESSFRALLTGDAALTALVGARIYWNAIPQNAADPCVVMYRVAGGPGIHMQGSDGLTNATVQIDVRATKVTDMWAVRDAIVVNLHGFKGDQGGIRFRGIFLSTERQSSEKPGETLYHRTSLDFDVWSAT